MIKYIALEVNMKKRSKRRKKHGFFKSIFISIIMLALISGLIVAIPNGYIILSTMNDIKLNVTTKNSLDRKSVV